MTPRAATVPTRSAERGPLHRWVPSVPAQHGAWAFLSVPILGGLAVAGTSPAGWLLLVAWLSAYPLGYYAGRALTTRVRRGAWTRLARRELDRARPWLALTAALGLPLAWTRPWLLGAAGALALLWALGLVVADRRGERSLATDLLLVAQALVGVPMAVAVVAGPAAVTGELAGPTATCTAILALYLIGSVLHVKSLLREASRPGYRRASIAWHVGAAITTALVSPWWLIGFGPALIRSMALRPGAAPGLIGGIEAIVAVLVVFAAFLAL